MSKTDIQDGGCDGHLGFLITIFAHFDLKVVLLLQSKFQLKSTLFGKRCLKLIFKMVAVAAILNFQSAQFYSYFVSTRHPDAPHHVSTQLDHSL